MSNIVVTIFGNVVDEPRHLQGARGPLTKFRLAHTPSSFRDGAWVDGDPSFYDVTCFGRMADHAAGSLKKGEPVLVHGRLAVREWVGEHKSGKNVEITADHVGHDLRFGTTLFKKPGRTPAPVDAEFAAFAEEPPATEDPFAA